MVSYRNQPRSLKQRSLGRDGDGEAWFFIWFCDWHVFIWDSHLWSGNPFEMGMWTLTVSVRHLHNKERQPNCQSLHYRFVQRPKMHLGGWICPPLLFLFPREDQALWNLWSKRTEGIWKMPEFNQTLELSILSSV